MLKEETVTGANARRVINGEAPVTECRGEDEVSREKELTRAYFQLSLVDHYSMKEGALVTRVLDEELRTNYKEAMESFLVDHAAAPSQEAKEAAASAKEAKEAAASAKEAKEAKEAAASAKEAKEDKEAAASAKEAKEAREMEKMLASFTVRDRKRVLDKYSVLLYNHSLEKINVEEVLDRLKEKQ